MVLDYATLCLATGLHATSTQALPRETPPPCDKAATEPCTFEARLLGFATFDAPKQRIGPNALFFGVLFAELLFRASFARSYVD